MTWFALYTEPLKETFARDCLRMAGFENVFYPHIPEWQGLSKQRARLINKPYFPRYLFVDCIDDGHYYSELTGIWLIPGVIGPVKGTDRKPLGIPHKALQPLLDRADPLGAVQVSEAPPPRYALYRGNRVKVAEGNPLWGLVATIEDVDGKRIVATMSGLFGRVMIAPDQVGEVLTGDNTGTTKPNGNAAELSVRECHSSVNSN
jgi:transcription antitermination factor NusG